MHVIMSCEVPQFKKNANRHLECFWYVLNLLHTAICYKRLQTLLSVKLGEYKFPELLILKSGIFSVS